MLSGGARRVGDKKWAGKKREGENEKEGYIDDRRRVYRWSRIPKLMMHGEVGRYIDTDRGRKARNKGIETHDQEWERKGGLEAGRKKDNREGEREREA